MRNNIWRFGGGGVGGAGGLRGFCDLRGLRGFLGALGTSSLVGFCDLRSLDSGASGGLRAPLDRQKSLESKQSPESKKPLESRKLPESKKLPKPPTSARSLLKRGICKALLAFALSAAALSPSHARGPEWFETWGDVFSFLPLMAGAYSLARQDYEGVVQLALGAGTTLAITYASKYTFVGISQASENAAGISRRPNNSARFDGFPSGHTSSAFSAAGFLQKRYGWKLGVPATILATSVGVSRVVSEWHTSVQVIAGALLGYGVSYLFARRLDNIVLDINIGSAPIAASLPLAHPSAANLFAPGAIGSGESSAYQNIYKIGFSYRF
ncbi:hypothetical protein BKN38_03280 [Helicobacter sp. CLO-3]|uniref:phosphatase PAP2 family protein n=1 Tax=unclassified Helicobacter TaxID=2593540 RepID=UPI000805BA4C|nr:MULTISPECIES: phosphatase PAP2 family protein [unclassified Helicobacter]OBV28514.1 hypothetical protein BA723_02065 [Helicobacter sp. CLO-3]OHU84173.1 hypothetical protein BKN38_03280 [Helicobacter sp. CLO-3]